MGERSKPRVADKDDDELKMLGRSSSEELAASELDLVAGGAGVRIDPEG